ncbi:TPT-domain-containing protein [Lepidopterella palustris CBS 459.81]|uniref:TPT-domain-containing protein n=1 Tax=Lepidopterella palustris CBS 459.81 TaxID=1314670 RepID=A0A8E2E6H5_9PEZI|nr:TPT-domain-containing protein [Lepidopterella palustris CBS 459.81]
MTDFVDRWLYHDQTSENPPPDSFHAADEFPLATFSSPPSSTASDPSEALHLQVSRAGGIAQLIHPPTPTMEDPPRNHARRRSTSLAGATITNTQGSGKASRKHRRTQSAHILEEDKSSSDDDNSDSSNKTESTDLELDDMNSDEGLEDDEETGLTGRDRQRRRRRKRRHTRLDERVIGDVKITKEEEKLATQSMMRSLLINALLIGLWYLFSISISLYNKWMFKDEKEGGEKKNIFPFPLFTTCLHMIVQFSLASVVLFFIPAFRPRQDSIINPHAFANSPPRQDIVDSKRPLMTKWFYFTRIGPCGVATGMDIGLGNMSLKFISLTFFTMCKSSALGFVLIFAFLFRLEKPSWKLVFIILTMTVGVVMMVAGETAFNVLGFILVMSSALSSGFRWSLTQILLLRNPATSNPFSSIFFLAPVMFVSLLVIAIPVEGFSNLAVGLSTLMEAKGPALGIGILLFPGSLAFLMTSSEFALLKRTSVVTLSICGIFKEVVTISAANIVFDDHLTPINFSGLLITIGSIAAYNYIKIKKMREDARMQAHLSTEEYAPVLSADPDAVGTSATGANTRDLIRNSLSIPPTVPSDRPVLDSPARVSPIKRPENLD